MSRWSLGVVLRSAAGLARRAARWLLDRIAPEQDAPRRIAGSVSRPARVAATHRTIHDRLDRLDRDPRALEPPAPAADDAADVLAWGDFAGADEAERFAALPPIEPDAAADVDWDALGRDLTRDG